MKASACLLNADQFQVRNLGQEVVEVTVFAKDGDILRLEVGRADLVRLQNLANLAISAMPPDADPARTAKLTDLGQPDEKGRVQIAARDCGLCKHGEEHNPPGKPVEKGWLCPDCRAAMEATPQSEWSWFHRMAISKR